MKKRKWTQLLSALLLQSLSIATVVSQVIVWLLSMRVSLFPGQEAMQSIASTFAQIVAGLYGITMASYTFFLSRIDSLAADNATLEYVTNGLKKGFKYLIWHITFQVLMTLGFATVLMYVSAPEEGSGFSFWYRLLCNEFILFAGFSVALILYYSVLVINPNVISKEAARLKKKLGGKEEDGAILDFLNTYREIIRCCVELLPEEAVSQLNQDGAMGLTIVLALLRQLHPEIEAALPDLECVHRYYECVVNCESISVSGQMCEKAAALLEQLEAIPSGAGAQQPK